jgi:dCTP diphosphatase
MDSFQTLSKRLEQFATDRDWLEFHSPKNLSMALIGECGELIEHFQWLTQEQSQSLSKEKHREVAMELADIQIYLIRIADVLGVDLIDAANEKTSINEKRFPVDTVKGQQKRAEDY